MFDEWWDKFESSNPDDEYMPNNEAAEYAYKAGFEKAIEIVLTCANKRFSAKYTHFVLLESLKTI